MIGYAARWLAGLARLPARFESYDAQLQELHRSTEQLRAVSAAVSSLEQSQAALTSGLGATRLALGETTQTAANALSQGQELTNAFDQHLPAFLNIVSSSAAANRLLRREIKATRDVTDRIKAELLVAIEDSLRRAERTSSEIAEKIEARISGICQRVSAVERSSAEASCALESLHSIKAGLDSTSIALAELAQRVSGAESASDEAMVGLARLASLEAISSDDHARLEGLAARLSALTTVCESTASSIEDLRATSSYLLGRVEFVRRELLLQLRYGAGSRDADAPFFSAKILNETKVREALRDGLRLNLGCGNRPLEGYVNVDLRELPGVDVVAEASDLPFEPGTVVEIYSSHLLEHFPQEQLARQVLPHWRMLLRPGGTLRAVVPDAQAMIEAYGKGVFPYEDLREVTFGGQDYNGDFHYNMFTPESLGQVLKSAGFASYEIVEVARRNGRCFEFEVRALSGVT